MGEAVKSYKLFLFLLVACFWGGGLEGKTYKRFNKLLRNNRLKLASTIEKRIRFDDSVSSRMARGSFQVALGDFVRARAEIGSVGFDSYTFALNIKASLNEVENSQAAGFFKSKRVAVVGPCPTDTDDYLRHREAIEENDIVARVGYAGPSSIPDGTGSRCDVSFYAGHKVRNIVSQGNGDVFSDLKLCVVKTKKDKDRILRVNPEAKVLVTNDGFGAFVMNKANAGVSLIADVLGWGAESIEVYNVDLFITTEYPAGYISNERKSEKVKSIEGKAGEMRSAFITHNPFAHFQFFEVIQSQFAVNFDQKLSRLIENGMSEYAENLQVLYGVADQ